MSSNGVPMHSPKPTKIPGSQVVRKKRARPYSRRGCQRCKKMKVKCDEVQPKCTRCYKSNAECEYPDVRLPPLRSISFNGQPAQWHKLEASPVEGSIDSMVKDLLEIMDDDLSLQMDKAIEQHIEGFFGSSPLPSTITRLQVKPELLKPIYNSPGRSPDQVTSPRDILSTTTIFHFPTNCFQSLDIDPSHKKYLDLFYTEFSEILMPLRSCDEANTIRDILLQYSLRKDYLYFAVLSSGARIAYKSSNLDEDEQYFTNFLKKTSGLLSDYKYIQTYCSTEPPVTSPQPNKIVNDVLEPLLLTILLLTSDNASSMKQSWRGHLRGAKELLLRVFVENKLPQTKVLIFCKAWFVLFEVLAGLSAPYGGTLVKSSGDVAKDRALLELMSWDSETEIEALRELRMITEEGFIFTLGFHTGLLSPLFKLIEMMRRADVNTPPSSEIFGLITEFEKFRNVHPTSASGSEKIVIWFEAVHQSYIDAALLTIISQFLRITTSPMAVNPVIQELSHSVLTRANCLLTPETDRISQFKLMMDQWPLLTAGLHSVTREDRAKAQSIFQLLTDLGSGSAKYSLQKMKRAWARTAGFDPMGGSSSEGPEEVDIVTY